MTAYILRRLLYAVPILIGVNLITFLLFFVVNSPDDMARMQLGVKRVTPAAIETWKREHGYDQPLLFNDRAEGLGKLTETIFFRKSVRLFAFDFGSSDSGRDIGFDISQRMWPSLAIAVPVLLVGLLVNISLALFIVFFRATYIDYASLVLLVAMMSISGLFYIIGGQYLLSKLFHLVPISGYDTGPAAWKFLILPVIIGVIGGVGAGTRWYRTLFLEEIGKDYVRTARAKGLGERLVLFRHVLGNALIPILTGVVVVLPLLFMGSLITESFFGIPGLGSYTIDAINNQDFAIVRAMVFLGSVLYILGLLLTDISYTLVDPRVRLGFTDSSVRVDNADRNQILGRPREKRTDSMSKVPMTAKGAEQVRSELEHLKRVERPRIIEAIAEARSHGDLKENAEYHAAREQQGFIEGRIKDLENKLSLAHIVDVTDEHTRAQAKGKVIFGATVDVLELDNDQEQTLRIVGDDEADSKRGLISISSPIARALIGKQADDVVGVETPGGLREFEILEVRYE